MTGDELGEIAPVRADVGKGARRAAQLLVHPPVGVVGSKKPVLEVGAVEEAHRAGLTARDPLAGLAHRRVVAVDEGHRCVVSRLGRRVDEPLRAGHVERQRLLADHVLSRRERCLGERQVEMVRRADVHDVHVWIANELLGGVKCSIRAERGGSSPGRLRRRGGHTRQMGAGEKRRASVDSPDEPGPRNGRLDWHRR